MTSCSWSGGEARQTPVLRSVDPLHAMRALLPLIAVAAIMAGCGYKGPLYLPKPKPGAQQPATPPAQQENEKKSAGDQ